ncbi:MAG: tetraacyldisaccharide 4'-kinase [Deltaproteobacteria bacterium]|nr:tetraacyldisaccharide 4'-kinase [Deltaproteobacteria bacterium]
MRVFFQAFWYKKKNIKKSPVYFVLLLLSWFYRFCLVIREHLLKRLEEEKIGVPVISVGNLSVGGEGKTPLVIKIASMFLKTGLKPGIVMRGYKRKKRGVFIVDPEKDNAETCGDEAYLIARNVNCPVAVGIRRERAVRQMLESRGVDLVILDDGFQVRRLKKDVEIVIMKTERESLNFHLFPLGPMREPLENIKRSDLIVFNLGFKKKGFLGIPKELTESKTIFFASLKPLNICNIKTGAYMDFNYLKGKEIVAFSGLADNESFFDLLKNVGAKIKDAISFPDHHFYKEKDIQKILNRKGQLYVTTEKDAVKLFQLNIPDTFYYLSVDMNIEREKDFFSSILDIIEKKRHGEPIWRKEFISLTQH